MRTEDDLRAAFITLERPRRQPWSGAAICPARCSRCSSRPRTTSPRRHPRSPPN